MRRGKLRGSRGTSRTRRPRKVDVPSRAILRLLGFETVGHRAIFSRLDDFSFDVSSFFLSNTQWTGKNTEVTLRS